MPDRPGCLVGLVAAVVGVVLVVVLALVLLIGVRGVSAAPAANVEITLVADPSVPPPVHDHLADGAVLRVRVVGLQGDGRATVAQCAIGLDGLGPCVNEFPVRYGPDDGSALFQYLVQDHVQPGVTCGPAMPACALVVKTPGQALAVAFTVFHGAAPRPPVVDVRPDRALVAEDRLAVLVRGLRPGTAVAVAECPPGRSVLTGGCARPVTGEADGRGAARLLLDPSSGRAGTGRCDRRGRCTVQVLSAAPVRPFAAPLRFASGPDPDYDVHRMVTGLGIAFVLLALAVHVFRGTDWREPAEAATPAMDAAAFDA